MRTALPGPIATKMPPESVSVRLDAMADRPSILTAVPTAYDPEVFARLTSAVVRRRRVEMMYRSRMTGSSDA